MASAKVPRVHHFELVEGMQLQINVSGSLSGRNVRVELQIKNCMNTWILHWGCVHRGNPSWFLPTDQSKQGALQTPFTKSGDCYVVNIELRDPRIHAVEFVLKDGSRDRWLKLNNGNFRIELPEHDENVAHPPIPKDRVERQAYLIWERKGRPTNSPQQQKQDYEEALQELQAQLSRGVSFNESPSSNRTAKTTLADNRDQSWSGKPSYFRRKQNVGQWLHKHSMGQGTSPSMPRSPFLDLVDKTIGDNVLSMQSYHVGNYEIVVLSKFLNSDYHILVAMNAKGAVLHWGVSKLSPGEWLPPPPEIFPEKSKLVPGACQTYFADVSTENGSFQFVDINLQQRNFLGIQFVIWSGGSWIKNNGANFFARLNTVNPSGKVDGKGKGIVKWLLDEIYQREKEAERSLMHRYNIATDLTERSRVEGELGLIGILVWLRFMACRYLTWNKNYNVKPREISEAQDRFTNLLQRIYLNQPNDREIVRLIMSTVGRGGQGDVGQKIRDDILLLQRNNDCKTGMMEEWHQKLHNNSSPDDVIICEALINYVRSDFSIDAYWKTLNSNGLTKEKLASYDRPIKSEPHFRTDVKEGLICDLTKYLKTLKAVHSGADLESAIEACFSPSSQGHNVTSAVGGLSLKLQECLNYIRAHAADENIRPLMEKLLDSRIELRPALLTVHGKAKDLLFLDLALSSAVRATMERGLKGLKFSHSTDIMFYISLLLENLCLSTVNNEALIYCTKDWYRVCESYKPNDAQWALQAKAVLDRLQLVLGERSQSYHTKIQPSAEYLGNLLGIKKWAIDIFSEELIRMGSEGVLSLVINHLDPLLRNVANLGCWQIISPMEASGFVNSVHELKTIQNKVYRRPTVVIANRVTGEEEIPEGVVAVLTPDMPDVLSHVAIRARNNKACNLDVCFATCFDQNVLRNLKLKEGKAISIELKSMNLIIRDISGSDLFRSSSFPFSIRFSIPRALMLKRNTFCGKFAILVEEFTTKTVGAKSCNIRFLIERVPSWIKIPTSVALPFGTFETVLSDDSNRDIAKNISSFLRSVQGGDLTKLQAIQDAVLQMKAPSALSNELKSKMKSARISWHGGETEQRWNCAWKAIKKVWASKWNERAYVSCRKAKLNHDNLCMAVLIQEVICGDYAFVLHTKNPLSGDASEIYAEIVKGLGETLVGAYPGRAMSFIAKKNNIKFPIVGPSSIFISHQIHRVSTNFVYTFHNDTHNEFRCQVTGYPSKNIALYSKQSVIFRSDSNGEDLEGYAGAGLYDSVVMDGMEKVVLDYSSDRIIVDKAFQMSLFSKIAEAGKIIEGLYGCPQDIEGVVKDGVVYVVQARPQI
ncbi:Alpha-glucan water dikinase 2 [Turnera subulata]|uniref:Alpha-glucan water dikinase 2 n=1 Tax=Turnera subulata TaxID=218843 RepID=A0A9Q0GMS0_9ROSI|nr:Alpha-glucan water dikinase 2 [Turnera subulata]